MAQLIEKREYRCDEDCERNGCPGHTAILEFYSVCNIYIFDDGQGNKILLDLALARAMIDMLKHYSNTRQDTVKL